LIVDIVFDIITRMGIEDKLKASKPLTKREAEMVLTELGYVWSHTRGSHHHWVKEGSIFTLPVHGKDCKSWVTRELRKLSYEKKK